jgi:uncharacterized SAM-binding protein YcdF (DUF218 family)
MIYHKVPKSKIVFSGYSKSKRTALAYVIAQASLSFAVNPKDTMQLRKPSNTLEEALEFKRRFSDKKIYLVTSAYHMPRAVKIFKSFGLIPKPIPTDFKLRGKNENLFYVSWGMNHKKFILIELGLHECVGSIFFPFQKILTE